MWHGSILAKVWYECMSLCLLQKCLLFANWISFCNAFLGRVSIVLVFSRLQHSLLHIMEQYLVIKYYWYVYGELFNAANLLNVFRLFFSSSSSLRRSRDISQKNYHVVFVSKKKETCKNKNDMKKKIAARTHGEAHRHSF